MTEKTFNSDAEYILAVGGYDAYVSGHYTKPVCRWCSKTIDCDDYGWFHDDLAHSKNCVAGGNLQAEPPFINSGLDWDKMALKIAGIE